MGFEEVRNRKFYIRNKSRRKFLKFLEEGKMMTTNAANVPQSISPPKWIVAYAAPAKWMD